MGNSQLLAPSIILPPIILPFIILPHMILHSMILPDIILPFIILPSSFPLFMMLPPRKMLDASMKMFIVSPVDYLLGS